MCANRNAINRSATIATLNTSSQCSRRTERSCRNQGLQRVSIAPSAMNPDTNAPLRRTDTSACGRAGALSASSAAA